MELFDRHDGSGPVALDGEDACRRSHLQDQIPVMGNGHEPVQGRSANDSVEGEVNLGNLELHVLGTEVILCPKCNR
jgi:hypothetical protein